MITLEHIIWKLGLPLIIQAASALARHNNRRQCNDNDDDDRCEDFFSQAAYCCGDKCCYYWRWYARWYFWFILGLSLMILSGCVTYWCKKSKMKHQRRVGNSSRTTRHTTIALNATPSNSENTIYPTLSQPVRPPDYPPTYQEIAEAQSGKGNAFKNIYLPYETGNEAPPPYTYRTTNELL